MFVGWGVGGGGIFILSSLGYNVISPNFRVREFNYLFSKLWIAKNIYIKKVKIINSNSVQLGHIIFILYMTTYLLKKENTITTTTTYDYYFKSIIFS